MKVLECSSKGDKRFSALYAKVNVSGVFDSIENHYQLCKRAIGENGEVIVPRDFKELKGKKVDYFVMNGINFPETYLTQYYKLLWVKYLDANPSLVVFAKGFDEFNDMFKHNSVNCQADVIRQYVKEGRGSIMSECKPLIYILNRGGFVNEVVGDLLKSGEDIQAHQTNCLGIMGAGIAYQIKLRYPEVFKAYNELCINEQKGQSLMGRCQIVKTKNDNVHIANLFGQHGLGAIKDQTNSPEEQKELLQKRKQALKESLIRLKEEAQSKNLSVGLPYQLGSGLAGGDWGEVKRMIQEVFFDYPVTIYKLPGLK